MKHLLISVGMAALLLPLGGMADTHVNKAVTAAEQTGQVNATPPAASTGTGSSKMNQSGQHQRTLPLSQTIVYLQPDEISVKDLLGRKIRDENGKPIGKVSDILFNADGQAETLVARHGGIFGLGAKKGALDFDQVGIALNARNKPKLSAMVTGKEFLPAPNYESLPGDKLLASELIGQGAELDGSGHTVSIDDVILSQSGQVQYVVASASPLDTNIPPEMHAVDYKSLVLEQGAGGLYLQLTPAMFQASHRFEYGTAMETATPSFPPEDEFHMQYAPDSEPGVTGSGLEVSH